MKQDLRTMLEQMLLGVEQVLQDAENAEDTTYRGFHGELLSQSGGHYIYQFTLRTEWEPEENSRIHIQVDKKSRGKLSARVISCIGATLMLSTQTPIPEHSLEKATFIEDTLWFWERLYNVLRQYLDGSLEAAPGELGATVLNLRPTQYGRQQGTEQLGSFVPNPSQVQAIEQGLGSELLFLIGAAGTGKSTVQGLLASHLLKEGLSILAVSHTNIATDNLFLEIVQCIEQSGDDGLTYLLHHHRLVRAGDPRHISLRTGVYQHLTVSAIAEARMGGLAQTRQRLEEERQALAKQAEHLTHRLHHYEARWQAEREQFEEEIIAVQAVLAPLEEGERKRMERIHQGIKQEQEKRDTAKQQLVRLDEQRAEAEHQLRQWRENPHLDETDQAIAGLEQKIQQYAWDRITPYIMVERAGAEIIRLQNATASTYFTDQMVPSRQRRAWLLNTTRAGDSELEARRAELASTKEKQGNVEAYLAQLRAQVRALKAQIIAEAQLVTTTITGAYLNLSLLQRQFDIVIIDEVSMIPVIAAFLVSLRATRRVIASGDPTQLLPVLRTACSEQAREQQMPEAVQWLARDLLSHRGITIADAIKGIKGCVLLREQGRMHPKILAPINRYIYQDMLTSRPTTEVAPPIAPLPASPLMLVDSSPSAESCTKKPSKKESRINEYHVKVVVALLPHILATLPERAATEDPTVPRISVLTPYRSQVKRLLKALRAAGLAHLVHVGTINTAQALQFEVVILDTVEAPGLQPFPFTFDRILDSAGLATDATRRLNVGHTRARYKLIYVAHLDHLRRHLPQNYKNDPKKQRLLVLLAEWAAREGWISSLEIINQPFDAKDA